MEKSFFVFPLLCILSSLFSPALYSEDFSSIDRDLAELETLIQEVKDKGV
jgi:hypothetical protein